MKLKRIESKEIDKIIYELSLTARQRIIKSIQAQLESCQIDHDRIVREIFQDIKNKRDACPIGGNIYHYLITPEDLQNFEQEYLEGGNETIVESQKG